MRLIAIQSYLYIVACALMSLGGISLLSFGFVEQADSFSPLLMPSLATSLLFAGAIIVSTIQRRGRLSLAFLVAMAAVVLSVVLPVAASGAYAFWGSGRNADELHWALALSYLTGASAVVMSMGAGALRWAARLIGLALVTLAGGALLKITTFEPGYTFGPLLGAVGYLPTLLLGMAAMLLTFFPLSRAKPLPLKTVVIAGATALLSCGIFYLAAGHAYQSLDRHSDLLLSEVQKSTERALREQLALLDRMAERWESLGQLPSDEYWRQEATSYLRDIPSLHLIGLIDGDSRVLRLESQEPNDVQWLQQFLSDSMLRQWLEHAWDDGQPHLSQVLTGSTFSESELLVVAPVAIAGHGPYQLIASVNVREVMNTMLGGIISGLALRVMQGDELIYETDSVAPHLISYPVGERYINFHHDQRWRVVSYISNPGTYPSAVLPTVVLLFGLVLSFFLTLSQQLTAVARVHGKRLQDTNSKLEESEQHFRSLFTFNPDAVFSFDRAGVFQSINAAGSELIGLSEPEIVGRHFSNWVIEADLTKTQRSFELACKGTPQRYELQIRNSTGQTQYLDVSNLPIMVGGEIVGVFGIAKDVTERERMTAELRKALQQSEKQTEQLARLGHAAIETAQCHDHQTLINYLVEQVRLTVGAHQAVISLTQGSDWGQAISGFSVSEKYADWRDYDSAPTGEGIYALVCETNEPIVLSQNELERHPRWRGFGSQAEHHPPMRGWIAAPLVAQDGSNIGLLQLSDKEDGEFGPDDLAIIQQYAQMVVSIVENNRLMAEVLAAEQRLKAQLSFTSAITDCMAEGLLAIDHERVVRFINPAARQWLAVEPDDSDVIGQPMAALLPLNPEDWSGDRPELHGEFQLSGRTLMFEARSLIGTDDGGGWVVALRDMSDQLRADQALRERDQFFSLSLEMFCMVSLDGLFIQVNPSFTDTLRRPANELIGSAYIDLVDQEDRSLVDDAVQTLQQGGQIHDLVVRVWDGHQEMHWLQLSVALGLDRVIYCVARDITEQRTIQQQLVQRNLILGLAGQTARLGGWSIELPDMQVIWSREIFSLLRFPQSYVPTLPETLALCPSEHREAVALALDACMTEGRSFDLDVQIHDGGDKVLDVRLTGRPVYDEYGEIKRISGALQDISERKQAQRELERLAERMTSTLESITDAFITVDNEWRFTYVNSEAATLLRTDRERLIGRTIWSVFPDLQLGEIGKRYVAAKKDHQAAHFETYYVPLKSWFEIHAYPSDEGLAVYFRDVSERKTTERELDKAIRELERSNRELQEFAFVASHDLQEPLRKIQTFSERLQARSERFDENDRDYLQRMSLAASRMQALIIDLLDYSRVNSRGQPLRPLSLDTVLDDVLNALEEKIAQTQARIERFSLPDIVGDASQLRQVLQNLINNAIKFQPAGQSPIIKVYAEASSADTVTLCIADNGIGFDEKYISKIFNPFQRLHGKEVYAGTGIGLAIVKKVIDRHGASITVSSAPGKGSVFRIAFPKNEAAVDAD